MCLTVVTLVSIKSSEHIHFMTESLYPMTNISPFSAPSSPWQIIYSVSRSLVLSDATQKWHHRYLSFRVWLTSLAQCPQSLSVLLKMAGRLSFLWLKNIASYICTTCPLSIHPQEVTTHHFSWTTAGQGTSFDEILPEEMFAGVRTVQ